MESSAAPPAERQSGAHARPCVDPQTAAAAAAALGVVPHQPQDNMELASQLQRLESSFSVFAEESNPNQLLAHLGRMAVEFHHLSSKVQKNEQRTSLLQVGPLIAVLQPFGGGIERWRYWQNPDCSYLIKLFVVIILYLLLCAFIVFSFINRI